MGGVPCWNINIMAAGKKVWRKFSSSLAPLPFPWHRETVTGLLLTASENYLQK